MTRRFSLVLLLVTGLFVAWRIAIPGRDERKAVLISSIQSEASHSRGSNARHKLFDESWGSLSGISTEQLIQSSLPLNRIAEVDGKAVRGYRTWTDDAGIERPYREGVVLFKSKGGDRVRFLEVEPGTEPESMRTLAARDDVLFAELDVLMERQSIPNDPDLGLQWHHQTIGSSNAWKIGYATHQVKVAIVDFPFQMNHPDLASNSVAGWDLVARPPRVITSTTINDFHSTHGAGLAAGVVNNQTGIAGTANCHVLPINLQGHISEMHDAIIWCADNGVRVVNISWDGCYSSSLNDAAEYLREQNDGMVFMAGINFGSSGIRTRLNYVDQPLLYAISATDKRDLSQTCWGPHIDFAAPGWAVYSTTSRGSYTTDNGTSYAAPLVAGVAAYLMSINPALTGEEIAMILQSTAKDLGNPGQDEHYGAGRIDFGRAAEVAMESSPYFKLDSSLAQGTNRLSVEHFPQGEYLLEHNLFDGTGWSVINPLLETNSSRIHFLVPSDSSQDFYRIRVRLP